MRFACRECGHGSAKRLGRCPGCREWNTFEVEEEAKDGGWRSPHQGARPLPDLPEAREERFSTGSKEFDRVLGGGLVRGSAVLLGGDPGIGKSTLLLQTAERVARTGRTVLYMSAEESSGQIRMRARRLGAGAPSLLVANGTSLDAFLPDLEATKPDLAILDSIQTVSLPHLPSVPGTPTQVRECAARLTALARSEGHALVLIGHVTKDGSLAGPRTLEHLVDAVLSFEGDRLQNYRLLRGSKNRFGSTGELGVFEMGPAGLADVAQPSRHFLPSAAAHLPGSVVTPAQAGTRTLLVEVQALTHRAGFGAPARRVSGVDANRLALLLAVMEKRAGLHVSGDDVFVSAAGGAQLEDPSSDLAVALAVASAFLDRTFPRDTAVLGEIGLGGEIRPCGPLDARLDEAARLGFRRVIVPGPAPPPRKGLACAVASTLAETLEFLEPRAPQTKRA